ncbi:MAG: hormogonium polysaccharide secretion pseudopilin HpsB [Cyanobacteria bacterium P01_E01_bin.42]
MRSKSSEAGFTIIESLLAVIVVGILIVAIGPVIALSAATRIQARRTEWATQAARTYLDGLRGGAIAPPPIQQTNEIGKNRHIDILKDIAAPGAGLNNCQSRQQRSDNGNAIDNTDSRSGYCTSPRAANYALYCVDGDNTNTCTPDSMKDFLVQASGLQFDSLGGDATRGYLLGIRVYRADGFDGTIALTNSEPAKTFTGGLGDKAAPMLITITEVTGSNTTYQNLKDQYQ